MIQYRILNDDLERSSHEFISLIEAIYGDEINWLDKYIKNN